MFSMMCLGLWIRRVFGCRNIGNCFEVKKSGARRFPRQINSGLDDTIRDPGSCLTVECGCVDVLALRRDALKDLG